MFIGPYSASSSPSSQVSGNVSKVSSAFSAVDVSINVTHKIVDCECNYMKETGMVCLHALALIAHEEEIDFNVMEWYEQKYHAEHYQCSGIS